MNTTCIMSPNKTGNLFWKTDSQLISRTYILSHSNNTIEQNTIDLYLDTCGIIKVKSGRGMLCATPTTHARILFIMSC